MTTDHSEVRSKDSRVSIHRKLLGRALVRRGMLSREQLAEVTKKLTIIPHLAFKQVISLSHKIPINILDQVDLEDVVLPLLPGVLKARLEAIKLKDRFAKNLEATNYVRNVETQVLRHETRSVESREYKAGNDESYEVNRFELNEATVLIKLETVDDQVISGKLHISHNSQTNELFITQDDDDLKSTLYYDLRQAFTNGKK